LKSERDNAVKLTIREKKRGNRRRGRGNLRQRRSVNRGRQRREEGKMEQGVEKKKGRSNMSIFMFVEEGKKVEYLPLCSGFKEGGSRGQEERDTGARGRDGRVTDRTANKKTIKDDSEKLPFR